MKILSIESKKHRCEICQYSARWKSDLEKHKITAIHKLRMKSVERNEPIQKPKRIYICSNCNKEYLASSGLWYHLKKCKTTLNQQVPKHEPENTLKLDTATVLEIIKQNQEFKTLILEQQNKIIELSTKPNTVNNTSNSNNTNNTNNNTNTFNLQFFLNETCKDAMNITDFIQNLNIQIKELENVGNNGYVSGISEIILSRIKGLEVSKRPLHCTDVKRETMYIRDENEWNKDTEEKTKLKQMIGQVAKENMRKIPEWRQQNPECMDMHDKKYEYCMQIMRNSLGDLDEKQDKMDEKIIKNIAKQVSIDKNTITYENN